MKTVQSYAAQSPTSPLASHSIHRREPLPEDIVIDILYCGVCHSDLHQTRGEWEWFPTIYPCVPGHEIIGRVREVGADVDKFEPGQIVAVGCMVDSCLICPNCEHGLEQYCEDGTTFTYNCPDKHSGGVTYGGYSESITVDQHFVFRLPESLDLAGAAPLLCAGITTYSPLRHWNVRKGQKVGIIGLGGLGHMAVKFAHAFGAHVVLFTTSLAKADDAYRFGAHEVVVSRDDGAMKKQTASFDFLLDTVSAPHDINTYLKLLKLDGTLTLLGAPNEPLRLEVGNLLLPRRQMAGSGIGGVPETQEMLDFCGKHKIVSDVEVIQIQNINEAYERLLKGDVRYRFVIDMASLKSEAP